MESQTETQSGVQCDMQGSGKTFWSNSMDACMLSVLQEHLHQGLKAGNGWKDYTINAVISEVNKIAHKEITKVHVQNRLKTMSKFKDVYYKLMSFSDFGYNPKSQTMDANPSVWEEALKVHSQLMSYIGKPMPKLLKWVEVLGNKTATGRRMATVTSATDDANASNGVPLQQEQQDPLLGENGQLHDFPSLDESAVPATSETSPTSHSSAEKLPQTKKRNRSMVGGLITEMTGLKGSVDRFAVAMESRNKIEEARSRMEDPLCDQCSSAIDAIVDMDDDTKLDALEWFMGDFEKKKMFLRIKEHQCRSWIIRKIRHDDYY